MKFVMKMELKEPKIRADYRRTIISFFKKAISEYQNGMFYKEIYDDGAKHKSLVWSIGFCKPRFEDEFIILEDKHFEITFKISDAETALIYYSGLSEQKRKPFFLKNGNIMNLQQIKMVREINVIEDVAVYKVLSPICLKRHVDRTNRDWYISIGDEDFATELERKLLEDLPYYEEDIKKLKYNFDGLKKVVVRAYGIKIPATIGTFFIEGDSKILNHIHKHGIGSKRNSGFGLVEAIIQKEGM